MAARKRNRFPVSAQPAQLPLASSAYLRCPNCNSTDLKKVSLVYQEGLFCSVAHTRFGAVAVGGHGPDFVIGKATTRGFHQSVLSKRLNPPVKWSYRKLILWWAVAFLSIGWIVSYRNTITTNSPAVLSPPLTLFAFVPTVAGCVLETQSHHLQASVFTVGTLVPLPTMWHFNGAEILALRNQQPGRQLERAQRMRLPRPSGSAQPQKTRGPESCAPPPLRRL